MGHEPLQLDPLDENCEPTGTTVTVAQRGEWCHVQISFELDANGRPYVLHGPTETPKVESGIKVVTFEFVTTNRAAHGNTAMFCSLQAFFYNNESDKESKTNEVTSSYFSAPTHYGRWNLVYPLQENLSISQEKELFYALHFSNPVVDMEGDFDPRLRLEPRG